MKHGPVRTVADVEARVGLIREVSGYAHLAHPQEDELHRDVLEAIANGTAEDPRGMALLARSTWDVFEFSRWYD